MWKLALPNCYFHDFYIAAWNEQNWSNSIKETEACLMKGFFISPASRELSVVPLGSLALLPFSVLKLPVGWCGQGTSGPLIHSFPAARSHPCSTLSPCHKSESFLNFWLSSLWLQSVGCSRIWVVSTSFLNQWSWLSYETDWLAPGPWFGEPRSLSKISPSDSH